jgi:ATP-binding cassette subfamily F protein 3
MSVIVFDEVAKSFGAATIFGDASFRVEREDRIGLVGPNGAGKSTLLKLMAHLLIPDAGSIATASGLLAGYLSQDAQLAPEQTLYDELLSAFAQVFAWEAEMAQLAARLGEPELLAKPDEYASVMGRYAELQAQFEHAGGYTTEQRVRQVLDGLGFSRQQQAAPAEQLSGGQRTRAALGKLLVQDPDILLLDEPTNHLDLAALEWLEDYLTAWRGVVVVVSHDRYFLDRVTQRTIEVADGRVTEYKGNYSKYLMLRAEHLARWAKEYDAQQEYIARTEDFIRRYKAGQRSKEARGRQSLLDRMERIERPPQAATIHFSLAPAIQSGEAVLRAEGLVAGYPGTATSPLHPSSVRSASEGLRVTLGDVEVRRGERVGLIGPNGSGKTTLLRTLVGELPAIEGRATLGHNVQVGYFAQAHDGLNARASVLDEVRRVSHLSEEGARTFLGRFLFTGDDVFKAVAALSGGERSRVALAKLTLQGANFLILDEPTNHLDLPSRQALEQLLGAYEGTLLFVSHDRYFVDALATRIWNLEQGAITDFAGNYTRYRLEQARRAAARESAQAVAIRQASRNGEAGAARGRVRTAERTAEQVEDEITAQEVRLAALEDALNEASAEADVERISSLAAEYESARAKLDQLYVEWEERAG